MTVFEPASYFTRRQSDLRYVRSPLTSSEVAALFVDGSGAGTFPADLLVPGSITALQIHDEAIGLEQILGDSRPPKIIASSSPQPALPDPLYPPGSTIMWMASGGRLWINRANVWELLVRAPDLTGRIAADQFADSIKPIQPVASLPTILQDPVTHLPTNYHVGDIIMLTATAKIYQLFDDGGFNYHWDPVVKAGNIDVALGRITALQLDVDLVQAAVLTSAYLRAAHASIGILTVDQLGVGDAFVDALVGRRVQSQYIDFTTLAGDTASVNWLTAGMIQSGAVTTDKLIVGSFDNLMEDGSFALAPGSGSWATDGAGLQVWPGSGTWARSGAYSAVKAHPSTYGGGWPATTDSWLSNRLVFDVKDGDKLYLEGWARNWASTGTARIRVRYYADRAGTSFVGDTDLVWSAAESASAWTFHSALATAPAGARWARAIAIVAGQTAGLWSLDDLFVKKAVASAYIDSLATQLLTTGVLDADVIDVRHLRADSITVGTLTVERLNLVTAIWLDAVFDSDVANAGGSGITGIRWHGASGTSAPVKLMHQGVLYTLSAGQTASRYVYLVLNGSSSAFSVSTSLPATTSGAYSQIVVATCTKTSGHALASMINFSSLVGNATEFSVGDTMVQLAGAYDPGTDSNVGLWIKNVAPTTSNWLRTRITHQYVTVLKGGETNSEMVASMGYDSVLYNSGYIWVGAPGEAGAPPFYADTNGLYCQNLVDRYNYYALNASYGTTRRGGIPVYTAAGALLGYVPIYT